MKWTLIASTALPAVAIAASVGACSTIETGDLSCGSDICTETRAPAPAVDAGEISALDAATVDATSPPDSGPSACPGGILYVSTKGSDTYDGCTTALPLASIGAAIARAAATASTADAGARPEIHVCAGSYLENLAPVTANVTLLGGYNCTTWTRTADYGYPTFDAVNETRLGAAGATNGSGATVTFNTAGVDASTVFDGFTVLLSTNLVTATLLGFGSTGDAYGILSVNKAVPTITNVHVSAGATAAGRSIGIAGEHASVRVMHDLVEAGGGQHSIAVYLFDDVAGALVQNNTLHGGSATSTASEGLEVTTSQPLTGDNAIRGNSVEGGTGAGSSIGITIDNTTVSVVGNQISGGAPTCAQNCFSYGVLVRTTTNAFLADSNYVAGTTGSAFGFGIFATKTSSPVVTNNVVFGGSVGGSAAIVLNEGANGIVRSNTLASAGQAILIGAYASTTLENNLAVAVAPSSVFLTSDDCTSGTTTTFASIANNAAVGFAGNLLLESTACAAPVASGLAGLAAHLGAAASANVRIDSSCSDETAATQAQCSATTACATSTSACGASIVTAIDSVDDARAAVLDVTKGYPLAATAPCLVTQGGVGRTASVPLDVLGATRTAPVSIGAYEDDAACQ